MGHRCECWRDLLASPKYSEIPSLRGCVSAYAVTEECCSRPHPPCLGTDPSFPHEQEKPSWDPRGRCFPSPATSGEHLVSSSQDRQTLFWRKYITYLILFSCIFPCSFFSSPNASSTGLPALNPNSSPYQLPALVFSVLSAFPSTHPSRMQA